ncbi:MAG: lysostaphin resistance A-like protein [Candidatus Izemoplasmatales bacterium]
MKKIFIQTTFVFLIVLLLLGIPMIAGEIANKIPNTYIDPDGSFWWISVHHLAQALMFVPLFFLAKHWVPGVKFHLGLGDVKKGFVYVWRFSLFFLIYTLIGYAITFATSGFQPFQFDINSTNVFGYLGFQLFLSGPSEELIFRAFGIGMIALVIPGRIFKGKMSTANLLAAIIFGLAHVGVSFSPFNLSYSLFQVIYAIALGLIYGHCFEKTKSILYPMMMHSLSNFIAVGSTIMVTILIG